jgi:ankyrin repeat protein
MELLLRYGADPKNASKYGSNALHDAAMRGHADIIRLLLKNGADINAKTNCGYTALTIAIRNQNDGCANLLVELGSDTNCVDLEGDTLLHHARSLFWTDFFLKARIAINSQNVSKQTPLHVAIANCQVDKALFLIQQGADTTLRDIQHRKPLFFAKRCLKTADLKLIEDAIETKQREAAP